MKRIFKKLAISSPDDLIFGSALTPVQTRRGLIIGGGEVLPELNFTLPPIRICDEEFAIIRKMYKNIIEDACERAISLNSKGFIVLKFKPLRMTTFYKNLNIVQITFSSVFYRNTIVFCPASFN